jgi:hypothetical protein
MTKIEYPKWIYNGSRSILVNSIEEHEEHEGWSEGNKEPATNLEPVEDNGGKPRRGRPKKKEE